MMPKFMIVWKDPDTGDVWASFYESYNKARDSLSTGTTSVGMIGALYEYLPSDPDEEFSGKEYKLIEE